MSRSDIPPDRPPTLSNERSDVGQRLTNGEVASYNPLECLKFAEYSEQICGHGSATYRALAIWVGGRHCARSRHLFVVGCKLERYHSVNVFSSAAVFNFFLALQPSPCLGVQRRSGG